MNFLIAQNPQPAQTPQPLITPSPLLEGTLIGAAIVWMLSNVAPRAFDFWFAKAGKQTEADLQRDQQFQNAIIATLTKSQDAMLLQQNTLIASLLQRSQQTQEEISSVLQAQSIKLQQFAESQDRIHECLNEVLRQLKGE